MFQSHKSPFLPFILFSLILPLWGLVACQNDTPADLTAAAIAPTLTRQAEVIAVLTTQALTPRPTRSRSVFGPVFFAPTRVPTRDPAASPTPTPAVTHIIIPAAAAPPVLDGQLSTGEWTNAAALTVPLATANQVEVFLLHDEAHLYVAYTGLDKDPLALFPELFLDSKPKEQDTWNGNNWWFHLSTRSCWGQGNDILWQNCEPTPKWTTTTFTQNAATIEMQIPYDTIHLVSGANSPIRLLVSLLSLTAEDTEQRQLWPPASAWERPTTWGVAQPEENW
ncbi:MAG: hypothetical protein KA314_13850 [Chloroflexi bacterium]|nr:hypothetical protein [Chloroflexota bacterium]MBP8056917.1 hypothetical protein [Chloroflexota bacterium]